MTGDYRAGAERVQAVPTRTGDVWTNEWLPVGHVHAMEGNTGDATCGYTGILHDVGAWRDEVLRYCRECLRLVPFQQ